jgi:hypothetical protein
MTEELRVLCDIVTRLETAGIDYMLTGSVALNSYAQPRMTRDIDLVVAFFFKRCRPNHRRARTGVLCVRRSGEGGCAASVQL